MYRININDTMVRVTYNGYTEGKFDNDIEELDSIMSIISENAEDFSVETDWSHDYVEYGELRSYLSRNLKDEEYED